MEGCPMKNAFEKLVIDKRAYFYSKFSMADTTITGSLTVTGNTFFNGGFIMGGLIAYDYETPDTSTLSVTAGMSGNVTYIGSATGAVNVVMNTTLPNGSIQFIFNDSSSATTGDVQVPVGTCYQYVKANSTWWHAQ
jgi:hypothetical protein